MDWMDGYALCLIHYYDMATYETNYLDSVSSYSPKSLLKMLDVYSFWSYFYRLTGSYWTTDEATCLH